MDVVSILQKMRQPIESYRLEVSWERGEDGVFPRPVTKIKITHHLVGKDLVEAKVAKAVQLSDEKYCSVMATLRTPPESETVFNIGQ
jgi:putative redox protein